MVVISVGAVTLFAAGVLSGLIVALIGMVSGCYNQKVIFHVMQLVSTSFQ